MSSFFNNPNINEIIKRNLDQEIIQYGDYKYAYAIMNKGNPHDMTIINNHPSWFRTYLDGRYQLIDPVIVKSLDTFMDFPWDEKMVLSSEKKLMKTFKAGPGHTFVLHDNKDNLAVLSIFINNNNLDFKKFIGINKEELQYFLLQTHQKTVTLYRDLEGEKHHKRKVLITARENEILHWAGIGKSYAEIAIILGISISTVKFHMRNLVSKLGVSNAKHAIKLAAEMQIIRPLFHQNK